MFSWLIKQSCQKGLWNYFVAHKDKKRQMNRQALRKRKRERQTQGWDEIRGLNETRWNRCHAMAALVCCVSALITPQGTLFLSLKGVRKTVKRQSSFTWWGSSHQEQDKKEACFHATCCKLVYLAAERAAHDGDVLASWHPNVHFRPLSLVLVLGSLWAEIHDRRRCLIHFNYVIRIFICP